MRDYEVTVVFNAEIDEDARNTLIERVSDWLKGLHPEGNAPTANHWGQRQLAYPIKKQNSGYYVLFETQADPNGLAEFERNLLYVDEVLRHLVVRKES